MHTGAVILLFSFLLCLASGRPYKEDTQLASITFDLDSGFHIHKGFVDSRVAEGEFTDQRYDNGWTFLSVSTNSTFAASDSVQAYAAGLVEGYLTRDIIAQHWNNTVAGYCNPDALTPYCQRLKAFLDQNFNDYLQRMIKMLAPVDPYWHQVELFLYQLNGLADGYRQSPGEMKTTVDPFGMLMFQINGDLEDLEYVLKKPDYLKKHVIGSGSCSALIKLLPDNKELYISQDTWSTYQSMLRVIKRYSLDYHMLDKPGSPSIPAKTQIFSSYPGNLYSGDDFYMLSSGLVSIETTIGNSNPALMAFIQPDNSVMEGIRTQIANRLAVDGATWADIFSRYNSGTYNNEWMVLNYNKFTPGQTLRPGTLIVLEQLPGMIKWDDVTKVLNKQKYWASYNSPYFPEIFNASGTPAMVAKFGDWFTYDKTPRALIFRRDQDKVVDVNSMIKLMRYNDYKNDELSKCDCSPPYSAENAISARSDLNPKNGTYPFGALGHRSHGGTDMKMTSYEMFKDMSMIAVCGPTHDDQPVFSWSTADFANDTPHEGHPDAFNFDPVRIQF